MKKFIFGIILLALSISLTAQHTAIISPVADAFISTFGGGEGRNTFFKFDISFLPANIVTTETKLHAWVYFATVNWDGDMMYIHYLNQLWTEDSTHTMWNIAYWGDTLHQIAGTFGIPPGLSHSIDLSQLLMADYIAGDTFFSFRMKDPDDPTMLPPPGPISNYDSLIVGHLTTNSYIFFRSREYAIPDLRPSLTINYVILPSVGDITISGDQYEGGTVLLSAPVTGDPAFSFQWQKDSVDIIGATDSILTLSPLTLTDAGFYRLIVENPWGADTSAAVELTVSPVTTTEFENEYGILISPNPFTEYINIAFEKLPEYFFIEIYDLYGKLILSQELLEENIIDLSSINKAAYVVKIGKWSTQIIKQ